MTGNKKDYNFIAALEKAVAEKYGKEAAQDIRSSWNPEKEKEYLRQLKNSRDKQKNHTAKREKSSRTCPVCKTYSFSGADDLYMNRFNCCYMCYVDFVERREDEWKNGSRPTEEFVEKILKGRKNHG
tara:strand:+ start:96 stop:476 length:381 start_codon:yes stop_codon:yes gene_type:complete